MVASGQRACVWMRVLLIAGLMLLGLLQTALASDARVALVGVASYQHAQRRSRTGATMQAT
ncbi:hypothetical protein MET9862_03535 [Methylobacterium symbioticum]|uniref:Uncharacterized protein n=1 Tax=Methylobacterium symbioticum TaxID=2584084 RepID=A0A509EFI6_9HYPH|nr:hypothetical protein MET9862_03535 [Methylobacterium symbioticum]